MKLRKRIEQSQRLAALLASPIWMYLKLCQRTTRWQSEGEEDLRAALSEGPIFLVMWHSRLIMSGCHWPHQTATLCSLHDTSPIGRVVGKVFEQAGMQPVTMSRKKSNQAASRTALKRLRSGMTIGMTADGPLGPALEVNQATLEWARISGVPIFGYAFSTTKGRRLQSWDQMLVPKTFGKGSYVFRRLDVDVPRKPDAQQVDALRATIRDHMRETTQRADAILGLPAGP